MKPWFWLCDDWRFNGVQWVPVGRFRLHLYVVPS